MNCVYESYKNNNSISLSLLYTEREEMVLTHLFNSHFPFLYLFSGNEEEYKFSTMYLCMYVTMFD